MVIGLYVTPSENLYCQNMRDYHIETIAFYNVENLFDTVDDTLTFDDDRTALGKDNWTEERYDVKIANISRVLAEIGTQESKKPPLVIGLCEIENKKVLEDLIAHPNLAQFNYKIVLYFTSGNMARWEGGMGEVMGNDTTRLYLVEHPLMMIIAIALITIGYSKHKKKLTSKPKFKMLAIFYGIAFLVVLSRIPWSAWF